MALASGIGAAAVAGGTNTVFQYNRDNFKYDREMRQKCEFKVLEFHAKQAGMWREDVQDIVDLTEKKMEAYLVVNTIQMGMALTLFTEGRLEVGTPQWLIRFYMNCLGSAFMYLLMSVWLSLHASVVAQASGTRLLTQIVRLPIPTWQHLDKMRTYAASFENLPLESIFRVPFLFDAPDAPRSTWNKNGRGVWASRSSAGLEKEPDMNWKRRQSMFFGGAKSRSSMSLGAASSPTAAETSETADVEENNYDVWELEEDGDGVEDLQDRQPADRPHINMLKDEAVNWQCHDAFARLSMSYGTQQMVLAISYYCVGYIGVQDGAVAAAGCIAVVMLSIAVVLFTLDFSLSKEEHRISIGLVLTGPCCVWLSTYLMSQHSPYIFLQNILLPVAYLSHACSLSWSLKMLCIVRHGNGAWLPMKFRATKYLDVFGWYNKDVFTGFQFRRQRTPDSDVSGSRWEVQRRDRKTSTMGSTGTMTRQASMRSTFTWASSMTKQLANKIPLLSNQNLVSVADPESCESEPPSPRTLKATMERLQGDIDLWTHEKVQEMMDPNDQERVALLSKQLSNAASVAINAERTSEIGSQPPDSCSESGSCLPEQCPGESATAPAPVFEGAPTVDDGGSSASSTFEWADDASATGDAIGAPRVRIQLEGNGDVGAEMPPLSRKVTPLDMSFHVQSDPSSGPTLTTRLRTSPLLLAWTEEEVQQFCRDIAKVQAKTLDTTSDAISEAESSLGSSHDSWPTDNSEEDQPWFYSYEEVKDKIKETLDWFLDVSFFLDEHRRSSMFGYLPPKSIVDDFHGPANDFGAHDPGKVPWKVLRASTWLLIALWCTGPVLFFCPLEYGVGSNFLNYRRSKDVKLDAAIDIVRIAEEEMDLEIDGKVPALEGASELSVAWPRSNSFTPRSLGCDPSGERLVLADDFGIYSGLLRKMQNSHRKLEAGSDSEDSSSAPFDASFVRTPPCTAFEGQALKDIGVVCLPFDNTNCSVLVLHANGQRLTECPLHASPSKRDSHSLPTDQRSLAKPSHTAVHAAVIPEITWKISKGWLDVKRERVKPERVESMAVNNDCLSDHTESGHAFLPKHPGCLVVGTTDGRVVQLRQHIIDSNELVPEKDMQQHHHSVVQGSLHLLPGGIVMTLRRNRGTVQALDVEKGNLIGEWRLPLDIVWITLCGGGNNLFMLGRKLDRKTGRTLRMGIWRFPLPKELQAAQDDRSNTSQVASPPSTRELSLPSTADGEESSQDILKDRLYET